jgi:hypothetical protein
MNPNNVPFRMSSNEFFGDNLKNFKSNNTKGFVKDKDYYIIDMEKGKDVIRVTCIELSQPMSKFKEVGTDRIINYDSANPSWLDKESFEKGGKKKSRTKRRRTRTQKRRRTKTRNQKRR